MTRLQKFLKENVTSLFALLIMGGIISIIISQNQSNRLTKPTQTEPTPTVQSNIQIDDWPSLGDSQAKVVFVEFGDYQCGFCGRFNQEILPQLKTKYIETGKVKFVYKDFIIFGENSKLAAQATHCANEQGKFFEYHDALFQNQSKGLNAELLKSLAVSLGLKSREFNTCLDSGKYSEKVERSTAEGLAFGVRGTPTSFINGRKIVGALPFSEFETEINQFLKD